MHWLLICVIAITVVVLLCGVVLLVLMIRTLTTGSYRKYIRERHDELGRQHDEQMRRVREDLDR